MLPVFSSEQLIDYPGNERRNKVQTPVLDYATDLSIVEL
jgi:hypothetical protein